MCIHKFVFCPTNFFSNQHFLNISVYVCSGFFCKSVTNKICITESEFVLKKISLFVKRLLLRFC